MYVGTLFYLSTVASHSFYISLAQPAGVGVERLVNPNFIFAVLLSTHRQISQLRDLARCYGVSVG